MVYSFLGAVTPTKLQEETLETDLLKRSVPQFHVAQKQRSCILVRRGLALEYA